MNSQFDLMKNDLLEMEEQDIKDVFEECNISMEKGISEYK